MGAAVKAIETLKEDNAGVRAELSELRARAEQERLESVLAFRLMHAELKVRDSPPAAAITLRAPMHCTRCERVSPPTVARQSHPEGVDKSPLQAHSSPQA
eukprot:1036602-Prymnesium_polylepis.1